MKERPILFSGDMVRALLDGRKTQTRRIVKPQPIYGDVGGTFASWMFKKRKENGHWLYPNARSIVLSECPYGQPGDRFWVRETAKCGYRSEQPPHNKGCIGVDYQAGGGLMRDYTLDRRNDYPWFPSRSHNVDGTTRWAPAIHMPRWASRITLEVADVRVERLNDISETDAIAEGTFAGAYEYDNGEGTETARESFQCLWDSLNAPRGYGRDVNPWVWVVTFRSVGRC